MKFSAFCVATATAIFLTITTPLANATKATFTVFLAHQNAPVSNSGITVKQDGKIIGKCVWASAQKGVFPGVNPVSPSEETAVCNFLLDSGKIVTLETTGELVDSACPKSPSNKTCTKSSNFVLLQNGAEVVKVFKGGQALVNLTMYVKTAPGAGGVKLFWGFKELLQCGEANAGVSINGYRVCTVRVRKDLNHAFAKIIESSNWKISCGGPAPIGTCYNSFVFRPETDGYSVIELSKL